MARHFKNNDSEEEEFEEVLRAAYKNDEFIRNAIQKHA